MLTPLEQARYDEVRAEIAYQRWLTGTKDTASSRASWEDILNRDYWLLQADSILSIPGLRIEHPDQKHPIEVRAPYFDQPGDTGSNSIRVLIGDQELVEETYNAQGWVRVLPEAKP